MLIVTVTYLSFAYILGTPFALLAATYNLPFRVAASVLAPLWVPGLLAYYMTEVTLRVATRRSRPEPVRRVPGDEQPDGPDGVRAPVPAPDRDAPVG